MEPRTDLQAAGDRELAERILAEPAIRSALRRIEQLTKAAGARRHLLATSTRLTAEMAPELHAITDSCRTTLGVEGPLELFVYPDPRFNAAAVKPERGRLLMMVSSALLEAFDPPELRFVIGHEVGHFLFEHHRIPTGALLSGVLRTSPDLTLQLFAWQRYAEISADRAGLVCAGSLDHAARALFKLASGISSDKVHVRIDQFLAQVGDLREEAESFARTDQGPRQDWFATHPFSPLRLKAAELCARSQILDPSGTNRAALEEQVQELMTLMDPDYLRARTEVAEIMRRLLFAGGVAIAAATGTVQDEAIEALERLLGPGSIPPRLKPDVIIEDLPRRIEAVKERVPPLRRAQVLRDLCVIARADGKIEDAEVAVIRDIASRIEVDENLVDCGLDAAADSCNSCPD